MTCISSKAHFSSRSAAAMPGPQSRPWAESPVTFRYGEPAPAAHLTPRQLEVLALMCEGLPNKLICRKLGIATGTVKVHISCILKELGATSRLQAEVAAIGRGLGSKLVAGA